MSKNRRNNDKDNSLRNMILILIAVVALCIGILIAIFTFTGNEKTISMPVAPTETPTVQATKAAKKSAKSTEKPTPTADDGKLHFTHVTASGSLDDDGGVSYGAKNVIDNNSKTAWSPEANTDNPWITVSFSDKKTLNGIIIENGYSKSDELYKNNRRAKDIVIQCDDDEFEYTLKDGGRGVQDEISFPNPVETKAVKIIIKSYYDGDKYKDICISEIKAY